MQILYNPVFGNKKKKKKDDIRALAKPMLRSKNCRNPSELHNRIIIIPSSAECFHPGMFIHHYGLTRIQSEVQRFAIL